MVRVGGASYTINIGEPAGQRISDLTFLKTGQPLEPAKDYVVGGWASVNESTEGPPIWDVVTGHLRRRHGRAPRNEPRPRAGRLARIAWIRTANAHSRRAFLRAGLAGGAAALAGQPRRRRGRRQSGEPAAERAGLVTHARRRRCRAPLRQASKHEAHVIRRDVAWLTASARKLGQLHAAARARRPHHAERALLRAASLRHRRDRSGRLPADDARPCRQAADLHARRHQAHAAREPPLFLRMRRQFRHGVARRAAQRLPVHPRHGPLRDVYRRAAEDAADEAGLKTECQVAAARRRRLRRDDPLAAARQGARRRADRLPHERRDAAIRRTAIRCAPSSRAGKPICG